MVVFYNKFNFFFFLIIFIYGFLFSGVMKVRDGAFHRLLIILQPFLSFLSLNRYVFIFLLLGFYVFFGDVHLEVELVNQDQLIQPVL